MISSWLPKQMIYILNNKHMSPEINIKELRRPVTGISFIGITLVLTLVFLVYFGAWFAEKRLEQRDHKEPIWWENTVLWVCPLH